MPKRSLLAYLPILFFFALGIVFIGRLVVGGGSILPSPLLNKPAPTFALPALEGLNGVPGFSDADLRDGRPTVLNVFASNCDNCRKEAPELMKLSKTGVRIFGLVYKDKPEEARRFLGVDGNPFQAVGDDPSGRVAIDFGVYGVPETFIIRGDGVIAGKIIGEIDADKVMALLKRLQPVSQGK